MWRDIDPRAPERDRAAGRGSRAGAEPTHDRISDDPRDVLTRDLDLPRGPARHCVRVRAREYSLSGSDVRSLAAVGAFRVVPAADLREPGRQSPTRASRDLERLRDLGLARTTPYVVGRRRTTLVTLTDEGRALLEQARRPEATHSRQAFYAGVAKPRELAHDSHLYRAYLKTAERLAARGARIRRVVLEDELKGAYQRFLQAANRGRRDGGGRPERDADRIARWAHTQQLPCADGHVEFPDVRVEYDDREGRRAVEDIEIMTPHYRGAHAAGKVRAGFTRYRAVGARLGGASRGGRGGRRLGPGLAEELLS
jgi:DNA-binding MarR family transcriptional regulator